MSSKFIIGLIVTAVIGMLFIYPIMYKNSAETIQIVVNDKERITTGSGDNIDHKYLVYCEGEVFENTDAITFGKWNSADFQNKLKEGQTYTVVVAGWRMPMWSTYRNIVKIVE